MTSLEMQALHMLLQWHYETEASTSNDVRRQEAVGTQAHRWHGVDDGEHVVVLEGAQPRHVMALVQPPARLKIVPQRLVGITRPHLHANLPESHESIITLYLNVMDVREPLQVLRTGDGSNSCGEMQHLEQYAQVSRHTGAREVPRVGTK